MILAAQADVAMEKRQGVHMRRSAAELDAMSLAAFETLLHDGFAVERDDMADALVAFPAEVMERLELSQSGLVQALRAGWLGRPGKRDDGRVVWHRDEVSPLVPAQRD